MTHSTLLLQCSKCGQTVFACINEPQVTRRCSEDIAECIAAGYVVHVLDAHYDLKREQFGCKCIKEEVKA